MKTMKTMKPDKYLILLEKFFRKEATPEEIRELTQWINHPEARKEFETHCEEIWAQAPTETEKETEQEMWHALTQKIDTRKHRTYLKISPTLYRIAATILLPISIGLAIYTFSNIKNDTIKDAEAVEIVVDYGQKASLTLPDGTKAWLNSASKLTYTGNYNQKERKIRLEGEAYFEVAKNPKKKFTVCCNGLNIEALGTIFNVKGYRTDKSVTAALLEGSIKVYDQKNAIVLSPNQRLCFDKTNRNFVKTEIQDNREIDFWRRNILYFKSTSLADIAKTLERMYGITILFETEELKPVLFSGSIRNNSLTNVFHVISLTYPLTYKTENDTIIIGKETTN